MPRYTTANDVVINDIIIIKEDFDAYYKVVKKQYSSKEFVVFSVIPLNGGNFYHLTFSINERIDIAGNFEKDRIQDKFKPNDLVVNYFSFFQKPPYKIGSKFSFVSYLDTPFLHDNVLLDCVIKKEGEEGIVFSNSNCLKLPNQNVPRINYKPEVDIDNNKVTFYDMELNTYAEALCKKGDKFNIVDGIALAMSRTYKDKELEKFIIDRINKRE